VSAGPYINYRNEAGTTNEPDKNFVPVQKKGWKIDPHVSNLRSREFVFQGVQVHRGALVSIGKLHVKCALVSEVDDLCNWFL
jgi:hypothetical protein